MSRADRSLLFAQAAHDAREPRETALVVTAAQTGLEPLAQLLSDHGLHNLSLRWSPVDGVGLYTAECDGCEGVSRDMSEAAAMAITAALAERAS